MVRINVLIKCQSLPACAAGTHHVHCMQKTAKGKGQSLHSTHEMCQNVTACQGSSPGDFCHPWLLFESFPSGPKLL